MTESVRILALSRRVRSPEPGRLGQGRLFNYLLSASSGKACPKWGQDGDH